MNFFGTQKTKTTAIAIAACVLLFFSSCVSSQKGFIKVNRKDDCQTGYSIDSLLHQKEVLSEQSLEIVALLTNAYKKKEPFRPWAINQLTHNFYAHLQIDSCFHSVLRSEASDSLKHMAREMLVESSANYGFLFQNNMQMRRMLNRGDRAYGIRRNVLFHSQQFFWAAGNRPYREEQCRNHSSGFSYFRFLKQKYADKMNFFLYQGAGFLSKTIGHLLASFYREPDSDDNIQRLIPYLQKWDIVVVKSAENLTDRFIPGYFGHAAISLGDGCFMEALQRGVMLNNPVHFAHGTSFLVIRKQMITPEEELHFLDFSRRQLGKRYDYHFNLCSPDRLSCTELVYLFFDDLNWKTTRKVGIYTMSPDELVETTLDDSRFVFPVFFDDQQLVEAPGDSFLRKLLLKE